jgi:branched-chain amino acid transport system substrate-binding protein
MSVLALAVGLAACGSSSKSSSSSTGSSSGSSSSGNKSPIKIGAVSSITGPIPIPDGTNGATAYFKALNAKGGINGRQVQYVTADDKANPALTAQEARKLINNDNVVAFAGGESLVQCPVNGAYYKSAGIFDVMGGAATPTCFTSSNISPTNVGLADDITAGLLYGSKTLHKKKICGAMYNLGPLNASYKPAIDLWTKATGQKLAFYTQSLTANTDLNGVMLQVKNAGCDALISDGASQSASPLLKAAAAQGAGKITQIFMGQEYISSLPKTVGKLGEGVYSTAEFEPFTGNAPVVQTFRKDMQAAGLEVTALAQSGWLAAKVVSDTIAGMNGPINKDTVGAALQKLTSFDTQGMTAKPYSFGPGNAHHPNRSVKMVQIKGGKWNTVSNWINVDEIK